MDHHLANGDGGNSRSGRGKKTVEGKNLAKRQCRILMFSRNVSEISQIDESFRKGVITLKYY